MMHHSRAEMSSLLEAAARWRACSGSAETLAGRNENRYDSRMQKERYQDPTPSTTRNSGDESGTDEPVIPVRQLMGKKGRVRLEHEGDIYLLRITRNDKLILTK